MNKENVHIMINVTLIIHINQHLIQYNVYHLVLIDIYNLKKNKNQYLK